jgi:KaiC/GvpD/RAD55 family RecA-like ATPase
MIGSVVTLAKKYNPKYEPEKLIKSARFRITPYGEYIHAEVTPAEWIVDGLMNRNTMTLITAKPGRGKSMAMMQLTIALASGTDWVGTPVKNKIPVVYFNAEDGREKFHERVHSYMDFCGFNREVRSEIGKTFAYMGADEDFYNLTDEGLDYLIKDINRVYGGRRPVFICDPLGAFKGDVDLNSEAMGNVIRKFIKLKNGINGDVIIVHHMSDKQNEQEDHVNDYLGATAIGATCRQIYTLTEISNADAGEYGIATEDRKWFIKLRHRKADRGVLNDPLIWRRQRETGLLVPGGGVVDRELQMAALQAGMTDEEREAQAVACEVIRARIRVAGSFRTGGYRSTDSLIGLMGERWADVSRFQSWVQIWLDVRVFVRDGERQPLKLP